MNRRKIESLFPQIAVYFRMFRDRWIHMKMQPRYCEEGFYFFGDYDVEASRADSSETSTYKMFLARTDTVIDIGANSGFFSLIAAKSGKSVVSIEPNILNFELLLKNISQNSLYQIEPMFCALANAPGIQNFYGGGQGASLLPNWGGIMATYARLVYCTTLDRILKHRNLSDRLLIKLDVEGAENQVLAGAVETLDRLPSPVWIVEHGFKENFDSSINPHFLEVFEIFWKHGYTCTTIDLDHRIVQRNDVESWIRNEKREFGWMYYLFVKPLCSNSY